MDFDAAALMEIQLALYVFHEAVSVRERERERESHGMICLIVESQCDTTY